ncbi:MAG: AI-2E family transporter [Planctomycetota bacterium]
MSTNETRYTLDRVVRLVLGAAGIVLVLGLLRYLSDVLLPFAAAVILAYLLNPLVTVFERKTKRRGLAVAITLGSLGIVGLGVLILLIPLTLSQVGRFQEDLAKLRDDLTSSITRESPLVLSFEETEPTVVGAEGAGLVRSTIGWTELKDGWTEYRREAGARSRSERLADFRKKLSGTYIGKSLDEAVRYSHSDEFRGLLLGLAKKLALGGWTVVAFALNLVLGLTGLIIVLLYLVFLLLDFPEYARTWPTFLPPQYREATVDFLTQFNDAMRRYFRGQSLVALLTGAMFSVGFSIIGLPMAVPFGLFIGLLSMVPYLPVVALVPAMLFAGLRAIETDAGFLGSVVLTLLVFAVVQVIQDTLITPRVMGRATGLRPIAILLGVFVWGKLLGFMGLLLSIPLTCLGIAYYRRYILHHVPATAGVPAERNPAKTEESS